MDGQPVQLRRRSNSSTGLTALVETLRLEVAELRAEVERLPIPIDNNASERSARGPAVARKNFHGSGSRWIDRPGHRRGRSVPTLIQHKRENRSRSSTRGRGGNARRPKIRWAKLYLRVPQVLSAKAIGARAILWKGAGRD